jgi:hypothetical protein
VRRLGPLPDDALELNQDFELASYTREGSIWGRKTLEQGPQLRNIAIHATAGPATLLERVLFPVQQSESGWAVWDDGSPDGAGREFAYAKLVEENAFTLFGGHRWANLSG